MYYTMNEIELSDTLDKLIQEIRRGALVLATLSQLKEAKYGYALINELAEKGLEIDQGTLYPLLRRLESQGLLESSWDVDGSRPRRYYVMSPAGETILEQLTAEWDSLSKVIEKLTTQSEVLGGKDVID